jgi:hypothetical protein
MTMPSTSTSVLRWTSSSKVRLAPLTGSSRRTSVVQVVLPNACSVAASIVTGSRRASSSVRPATRRSAEFAQSGRGAVVVCFVGGGDEVDVVGLASCSVELGGEAADHDVVDPVALEYCEDSFGIEPLRFSRHGRVRGPR